MSLSGILLLLVVGVVIALAWFADDWLNPPHRRDAFYAEHRAALLVGTVRQGISALPAAAMEIRRGEHRADLLAVYDDGTIVHLRRGPRTSIRMSTPNDQRMGEKQQRFRDAIAAEGEAFDASAATAAPPVGTAVAYWRRGDSLRAGAPAPLEDVQGGRHALSRAWEAWDPLVFSLKRR